MTYPHLNSFARSALGVAVAIVVAAPALAQNTTAAIGGRVVDGGGKAVAGAAVSILHTESGATSTTTTDAEGRYAARGLRVGGPYTITIRQGGQSETRSGIVLALAETLTLDATLGNATVVVTGQALNQTFSRSNMGAGTNINSAQLNALASVQRNLQDYARTDPRVAQTDKERGEISALGQNSRFNRIMIDGVTTNDTFGLESNNLPTAKQPISIDAIQSVQVNVANYDVTQKGYTGASINAVTKSGSNEFAGSVYYVWRDESLTGKRINRTTSVYSDTPAFTEDTKGFTFGGPILKDKLFFFASYEELKSSKASPDFGPIGGALTNVGITADAIRGITDIAKTTWGFDAGGSAVPTGTATAVRDMLLKLDWTISDDHRASLRYTKTEQTEPFFSNFGTRSLSLSSHWYDQQKSIETVVAQWFADWSPGFSTEAKLSHRDYKSVPRNASTLPAIAFDFGGAVPAGVASGDRTLWIGTERSRHFNELATKTLDGYLGATWALGKHELKFGGDFSQNQIFNAFLQDTNGQYKFQCESAYSYSFGAINCGTATAAAVEAAVLENFRLGRASAYQAQLPLTATGSKLDGVAQWNLRSLGLFLQDTWRVDDKLTLTLGARLDQTGMPDTPLANPAVAAAATVNAATGRAAGGFGLDNTQTLDGKTLFQPRLGFNWNLGSKERRLQVRGGVGLFEGEAANVWLSNPYSNTGVAMGFYGCGSSSELSGGTANRAACLNNVAFTPSVDGQPRPAGTPPAPGVDILAGNLRQPAVWKMNLALDAELPWWGLVAGAELVHTKVRQGVFYQHLNLGQTTRTGSDGRELFYNASGYNRDCWSAAGAVTATAAGCGGTVSSRSLNNPNFGNVLLTKGTTKGSGDALTLALGQQPSRAFGWQVAYTRTGATEVSPLTSSVANSNFNARSVFNPNEEVAANSAYLIRDRVSASLTWSRAFVGNYSTRVGLFYEGRKGKPYSWTYYNDLNGDGLAGNDLMYIPSAPGSGEVVFEGGAAEEAKFWDIVNADSSLSGARGGVVKRNAAYAPWVNSFDLRISQEVPGFLPKHKGVVSLDFLNFANLLNKRWGRINEVAFQSNGGGARSFVNYKGLDANGKYVYSLGSLEDYVTKQAKGESQWALQVTARYEF
ncbi:MAG: TonB-dependent receptor [Aquabacterium sp.]|nr:TonB-dependent receptor [Aquabacterium sp.]